MRGKGATFVCGSFSSDIMHTWEDKRRTAQLSELKQTWMQTTRTRAHTYEEVCVLVELAQAWGPSGVCQGSLRSVALRWLWWMICQDNVPLMPSSPLPRRGTAHVCVGKEEGGDRGYLCVCSCWCVGVCSCVWALLSVYYFGNPWSHMWMAEAEALHESAIWGQGVNEMAEGMGVKHSDPLATTLRGILPF